MSNFSSVFFLIMEFKQFSKHDSTSYNKYTRKEGSFRELNLVPICYVNTRNTIFNILKDWDPLKIILAIWTPNSHVRLIYTRLYFRRVVSIKMRVS